MNAFLCLGRQCYCTLHLFPPVLCDDAVEVLGPRRPAKHTLWVIVTGLITQHGAFARGIRAGGVPWVLTPRHWLMMSLQH